MILLILGCFLISSVNGLFQSSSGLVDGGRPTEVEVFVNVHSHPKTGFTCDDKNPGEYYADPMTKCAVYYICLQNQYGKLSPTSFACPNGTIFNQATKVCSPHETVYCDLATRFYDSIRGNIDSKGKDSKQYPHENEPKPHRHANIARPQLQPQPQPQPQLQPQLQPQPQPQPQPQRTPILVNSRRNQFSSASTTTTTTTTTTTSTTPQPPPVEYVYDYDYDPNSNPAQPAAGAAAGARAKRDLMASLEREDFVPIPNDKIKEKLKESDFSCANKLAGLAYADVANDCAMYHVCLPEAKGKLKDYQMFCDQEMAFDQLKATCEPVGTFDCSKSQNYYAYDKYAKPEKYRKYFLKAKSLKSLKHLKMYRQ